VPVECPYCGFKMNPKPPRAGEFKPSCPSCKQPFKLIAQGSPETGFTITVEPLQAPSSTTPQSTPPKPAPSASASASAGGSDAPTGVYAPVPAPAPAPKSAPPKPAPSASAGGSDAPTGVYAPVPAPAPAPKPAPRASASAGGSDAPTGVYAPVPAPTPAPKSAPPKSAPPKSAPVSSTELTQVEGERTGVYAPPRADDADVTGVYHPDASPAASASARSGRGNDRTVSEATGVFRESGRSSESQDDATGVFAAPGSEQSSSKTRFDARRNQTVADARKGINMQREDVDIPRNLGGYEIIRELGRGGMGAVYLARQVSLDRPVALKVMSRQFADDPVFLARFMREAYAAAQLVHHNVVQIYDIGSQDDLHFFSMEFVEGRSLGDLIKKEGKLDAEVAVGYTLQAARGLKFGHDHGMIHRDIKPDNLMLNIHGVVKVADLGLVKLPGQRSDPDEAGPSNPSALADLAADVTSANVAMGTPAYMSPEQCRDAANVDHRADIYSLGCTLYVLLTGRPPFEGRTAIEVMTKHATEAIIPPEQIVDRVPKSVSKVLLKMMAKNPDDRHADMGEVIRELEEWLGVSSTGKFSPREEDLQVLERCIAQFDGGSLVKLRRMILTIFFGVTGGLGLLLLLLGLVSPWAGLFGASLLSLGVLSGLAYFVIDGVTQRSYLFTKVRDYLMGNRLKDWLQLALGGLLVLLLLWVTGLFWIWVGLGVVSVLLAFGLYYAIDRRLAAQRAEPLADAERMFKQMRLKGLEEDALRQFVWKFGGPRVEEFYEALFGYEAKLAARMWVNPSEERRPKAKFAAWREPIIRWIEARQEQRRLARERAVLQKLEEKRLKAEGASEAEAKEQAANVAEAMVEQAAEIKKAEKAERAELAQGLERTQIGEAGATVAVRPAARPPRKLNIKQMADAAAKAKKPSKPVPKIRPIKLVVNLLFGGQTRFILGAVLLAGGLLWMNQNGVFSNPSGNSLGLLLNPPAKPLNLPGLPEAVGNLFKGGNAAIAGLILIGSSVLGGAGLFYLASAVVAVFGPGFIPEGLVPFPAHLVSLALAGVLAVLGFLIVPSQK
jgi:serine/threonine protein kinase